MALQINANTYSSATIAQRTVQAFGEDVQEYSAPVVGDDGERLGTIVYGFSNQRTRQAVAAAGERSRRALTGAFMASGALGLLSLLVGIVWVLSSTARITRPVAELTAAANQISAGRRGIRVSISSGDEIEILAAAFNQMLETNEDAMRKLEITTERALAADRLKSEFLANTSHEIRTPMNGVLGMIQLIKAMPLDGKLRRYVDTIGASANALLTTINDILDFSKMEAGKLTIHPVPFDPATIVQEVAELLAHRAYEKGVEFICRTSSQLPPLVVGDPDRFRQVLNNLVGNAVKFTEQGEVFVDLGVASRDAGSIVVRVAVHDTGIGMDSNYLPKLYEAFSQMDATQVRRYGGTGLGLAICKRLVNMMGGEIHAQSKLGKGSVFTFTVRLGHAEGPSPITAISYAAGRRVLVVEPNRRWRDVIGEHLVTWQVYGESSETGSQALEKLTRAASQGQPFDAALLSATLSDISSVDLVRAIRAEPLLTRLRLIVMALPSTRSLPKIEGEFIAELYKPIRFAELHNCLLGATSSGTVQVAPDQSEALPTASSQQILVVDDNDINRFVAVEELALRGYRTSEASNGQEAFEKFKSSDYLCVLMDCQMPLMDGCEATRAIRRFEAEEGRRRTPIIALTAHALIGERERVLAAGMDNFLSKPFHSAALDRILKLHIRPESGAPPAPPVLADLNPQVKRSEKLIRLFLERVPSQLDELKMAIDGEAEDTVKRIAHKIKGSSLALAADRMSKTAEAIERHAIANELSAAAACLTDLLREHATVASLLAKELASQRVSTAEISGR
jgi:signal transduction histidine kinase/DNA-binding response OmpR family regulator